MTLSLQTRNAARAAGAALNALRTNPDDLELLSKHSNGKPTQRTSTLQEYRSMSGKAVAMVDDGFEPYLVLRGSLEAGMSPLMPVYDVLADGVVVGNGKRILSRATMSLVVLPGRDALLHDDTLLVWK